MSIPRIYYPNDLKNVTILPLDVKTSHYLLDVLRLKPQRSFVIFNGRGGEYHAQLVAVKQKIATIEIHAYQEPLTESPLKITLGQGISRGERMDYAIQKSVELGVNRITPLLTTRCNVSFTAERLQNRLAHWQGVIISACEQSGRCMVPELQTVQPLSDWLTQSRSGCQWVCDPAGDPLTLTDAPHPPMTVLIGPEGGLTTEEIQLAQQNGFTSVSLGPRVLRTETASVTILSLLQYRFGDI